jgi:hypothetical protein
VKAREEEMTAEFYQHYNPGTKQRAAYFSLMYLRDSALSTYDFESVEIIQFRNWIHHDK